MSEAVIENTVVAQAEMQGWLCRKVQWIGRRGAPDHVFMKGGRIVWIEFKDTDKEPNLIQKREIQRMAEAGAEVYVCDSISSAKAVLGIV